MKFSRYVGLVILFFFGAVVFGDQDPREEITRASLRRALHFFRNEVAVEGGYVWRVSEDLTKREGEGKVGSTTIWVQPPGTPAVGLALLEVWKLTHESVAREGALAAGHALVRGQMKSGGWNSRIEFAAADRVNWAYRGPDKHSKRARNTSVLDDNTTQAALTFLLELDIALQGKDPAIHSAVQTGLAALLDAQFTNGAFPQVFDGTGDRTAAVDRPARVPATWSRAYTGHNQYWHRPTLNDNVMADVMELLFLASERYGDAKYAEAASKAGDFLLLAQLPEPQPGWAQQYSYEMEPIWARKFEPPAITGSESRDVLNALLLLREKTGDKKWLKPFPRALAYYKSLELADGRLARFYEMGTDRPLYFTRDYVLTYDDSDVPTHYSFKVGSWVDKMKRAYEDALVGKRPSKKGQADLGDAMKRVAMMDPRGAWVEDGYINSATFNRNIVVLAEALAASAGASQ